MGQTQLRWEWTDTMRWDDVPAEAASTIREHLLAVLRQAAQDGGIAPEAGDE
jgi:hypothetical protein